MDPQRSCVSGFWGQPDFPPDPTAESSGQVDFSEPQFHPLENGDNNVYITGIVGSRWLLQSDWQYVEPQSVPSLLPFLFPGRQAACPGGVGSRLPPLKGQVHGSCPPMVRVGPRQGLQWGVQGSRKEAGLTPSTLDFHQDLRPLPALTSQCTKFLFVWVIFRQCHVLRGTGFSENLGKPRTPPQTTVRSRQSLQRISGSLQTPLRPKPRLRPALW